MTSNPQAETTVTELQNIGHCQPSDSDRPVTESDRPKTTSVTVKNSDLPAVIGQTVTEVTDIPESLSTREQETLRPGETGNRIRTQRNDAECRSLRSLMTIEKHELSTGCGGPK